MNERKTNLIYVATGYDQQRRERHVAAKLLGASLARTTPDLEILLMRSPKADKPLFKTGRMGLDELPGLAEQAGPPKPWDCRHDIEASEEREWILHLGPGALALRGLEHLLESDADILWAPMQGLHVRDKRTRGYLTEDEMEGGRRDAPISRPWYAGASSAVWAVRGRHLTALMEEWEDLAATAAERSTSDPAQSAWNRLLMDTSLRVARLEKGEVEFPCLPSTSYPRWKDAALINVGEWEPHVQDTFLQGMFYATFFGDPSGMFLNIVEP